MKYKQDNTHKQDNKTPVISQKSHTLTSLHKRSPGLRLSVIRHIYSKLPNLLSFPKISRPDKPSFTNSPPENKDTQGQADLQKVF